MNFFDSLKAYRDSMPFAQKMAMTVDEVREGYSRVLMHVRAGDRNLLGSVHGGALMAIIDVAGAVAAWSYGEYAVTLNCNVQFLNAALQESILFAEGFVEKHGKKTQVVRVVLTNEDGKKLCTASLTFFNMGKPIQFSEEQ